MAFVFLHRPDADVWSWVHIWRSTLMLDIQFILGGLITAFCLGFSVGKQFLVFRRAAEITT